MKIIICKTYPEAERKLGEGADIVIVERVGLKPKLVYNGKKVRYDTVFEEDIYCHIYTERFSATVLSLFPQARQVKRAIYLPTHGGARMVLFYLLHRN